jgi:DMSO/TMAO reductase YedYZ heme-binding membrane subunit
MLASEDLNRQPSIAVGMIALAILIAIFFACALVDRSLLGYAASLWDRGAAWVFDVSRLSVPVPSCPDPGGSWWLQGTLLCTR